MNWNSLKSACDRIVAYLWQPVDGLTLSVYRIGFALLMLYEVYRIAGLVDAEYLATQCPFRFDGFDWLPTPSRAQFDVLIAAMAVSCGLMAAGLLFRAAAITWFGLYTYVFLLEQTLYNNHYYLISLLSFLFCVTNADTSLSFGKHQRSRFIPAWQLWIFRFQFALVYSYAGIAKINLDWLQGEPVRYMLQVRTEAFAWHEFYTSDTVVYFIAYGGLLFDLLIPWLLLCQRTRRLAVALILIFHITNSQLFQIGVFPWLGIWSTILFLDPERTRRTLRLVNRNTLSMSNATSTPTASFVQRWVTALIAIYVAVQIVAPLRHFAYPGNVSWTEEGHNFAWHMKLRSKDSMYRFYSVNVRGQMTPIDQTNYLTPKQQQEIASRPTLLHRFARFLNRTVAESHTNEDRIVVHAIASLNGRPFQYLIDPQVDLGRQPTAWCGSAAWIEPLKPSTDIGRYPQDNQERIRWMQEALGSKMTERE